MAIIDAAVGGVGTGVQPKDSPDPSIAAPSAADAAAANTLKPIQASIAPMPTAGPDVSRAIPDGTTPVQQANPFAPPPVPDSMSPTDGATPQEQSNDDQQSKEVDDLLARMAKEEPKSVTEEKNKEKDELDGLLNQLPGSDSDQELPEGSPAIERALQGEGFWGQMIRNEKENFKLAVTKVRAGLDVNPQNMQSVFTQMYGEENVRKKGDTFQWRPEPGRPWRSMNSELIDGFTDFAVMNAMKLLPTGANLLTQLVTTPVLAPAGGLPGLAAAGAAGGTAEAVTREGLKNTLDTVLGIDPKQGPIVNEILWDAGINAAMPLGLSAGAKVAAIAAKPAVWAAKKAGIGPAATKVVEAFSNSELASQGIQKLANVRAGFKEIAEKYFPQSAGKTYSEIGRDTLGAIEAEQAKLGSAVGLVDDEALRLADEKALKSQTENVQRKISETLQKRGFVKNPDTGLLERAPERQVVYSRQPVTSKDEFGNVLPTNRVDEKVIQFDQNSRSSIPGFESALDDMAAYHNRLVGQNLADGGTSLRQIFNDIDNLDPAAKYGKDVANETAYLIRGIRGAAASDRDLLMQQAFEGQDTQAARMYKTAYEAYRNNVDSLASMQAMAKTPEGRDTLVNSFTKTSTEDRLEFVNNLKKVFGEQSETYQKFRGGVFNDLLNKNVGTDGVLKVDPIFKWVNEPVATSLYSKQEIGAFRKMLVEAKKVSTDKSTDLRNLSGWANSFGKVASLIGDPGEIVSALYKTVGGRKEAIDYMNDVGFLNLVQSSKGTAMYDSFLKALQMSEEVAAKSQIVDVSTIGRDRLKRYAPYAGPALAEAVKGAISPKR